MTRREFDWMNMPDGFEFGIVETDEEIEELIKFTDSVHEEDDSVYLRRLIENLPDFGRQSNYYIKDSDKGLIVSSINAIPSVWDYDGIPLRNLEMGFVGTLQEYRRKGLVRVLYSYFDRQLQEGEYDISTIQGIPHFYRQFGYDFLLPLGRNVVIRADQIPAASTDPPPQYMNINVRNATTGDLQEIANLYDELGARLQVSVRRDERLWEVQERLKIEDEKQFETMVLEHDGKIDGYFRVLVRGDEKQAPYGVFVHVTESSIRSLDSVMRTLQFLRAKAVSLGLYLVLVPGTVQSNLARMALDFHGKMSVGWKHQVRFPDILRFLNKIRPVMERRIKGTMFENLTRQIFINTHTNCFELNFENGKVGEIQDIGAPESGTKRSIRTSQSDFVRLILGEYTIEEINLTNIDFIIQGGWRELVTTIFPKGESYIFRYHC
ncbi:MAG: GNAT family N-acetyltransferase [Candidatus Thorarchaeota archaeon]